MARVTDQFADAVRGLIPINGLPGPHQEEVLRRGKVVKYRKGRHVFKQGDRDNFSFFVLEGELELIVDGQLVKQVNSDTPDARHALAQLQPRQLSARAKTPLQVFKIDRTVLDRLLADDRFDDESCQVEVFELEGDSGGDWMTRMLGSDLFSRLPAANIQNVFTNMEAVDTRAGDVIVEQGGAGDYYYIVQSGRCLVTRKSAANGEMTKLAELGEGDCFGEEALVSESERNATVTMLTDGQLMRLAKRDFNELIKDPTLSAVTYKQAVKLTEEGAVWLDVRFADEHIATGIRGSSNLPLNALRSMMRDLDVEKRYVVYCDSGGRSSAGAFLLAQRGFDACYLAGGLIHSPMGAPAKAPTAPSPPAEIKAPTAAPRPAQAKAPPAPAVSRPDPRESARKQAITVPDRRGPAAPTNRRVVQAPQDRRGVGPATREARVIAQELAVVKRELESMRKLKSEADAARRAAEEAMEDSLRTTRAQLEADAKRHKESTIELHRLRRVLEETQKAADAERNNKQSREDELRNVKTETETRLQREEKRLEAEQARHQKDLINLQTVKEKAEREIREEREALKRAAQDASTRMTQAKRLEQQLESARRDTERNVENKRQELLAMEQRLRADEKTMMERAQKTLAVERKKFEAELAGSREALARAQRQAREAAEAERRAAEKEAERVIAEYKSAHATVLAEELEKLKLERGQLEGEAERAQRALTEAQRIQGQAQKSQQAANKELEKLRKNEKSAGQEKAQLTARIQELAKQAAQATEELQAMERASRVAEAARDATAAELERQQQEEERLLDDSNRIISPAKLAELKGMRDKLAGKSGGRQKKRKKA